MIQQEDMVASARENVEEFIDVRVPQTSTDQGLCRFSLIRVVKRQQVFCRFVLEVVEAIC